MSFLTRRPMIMTGAVSSSGFVGTNELSTTRGGQLTATIWSGGLAPGLLSCPAGAATSGNQVILVSGQGRLHTVIPHLQMQSGIQVWFYDAALPARSGAGPIAALLAESGARVLGIIPPTQRAGDVAGFQSGYGFTTPWKDKIDFDTPFLSGLMVACASGAPGFSVSYTPGLS